MYQINDVVIYGQHNVCRIEKIGTLDISSINRDKLYYTLKPLYQKDSSVYAPVENTKVLMRPVISKQEATDLIAEIPSIESIYISDEKAREKQFKEVLASCDCREMIKIIKTLYMRKQERLANGKKVTALDDRYFRLFQSALYQELAFALDMEPSKMESYIFETVEK